MRRQCAALAVRSALAAMLVAGTLVACGGTQAVSDVAEDEQEEVVEVVNLSGEDDDEDVVDDAQVEEPVAQEDTTASGTIQVGDFSFALPTYWEGSVEVDVEGNRAVVHLPGNPEAELASLELLEGDRPEVSGDIGRHLAGSVASGNGTHVEVWTTNWPWLAANEPENLTVSDGELATLVTLSTGGVLTVDDLASDDEEVVTGAEYGFMSAELVPTIAFG